MGLAAQPVPGLAAQLQVLSVAQPADHTGLPDTGPSKDAKLPAGPLQG